MDSPISFKGTLKMSQPQPLFCLLLFFSNTNFTEKTVGVSGTRTRIVGVEGEHAEHLTTATTAPSPYSLSHGLNVPEN